MSDRFYSSLVLICLVLCGGVGGGVTSPDDGQVHIRQYALLDLHQFTSQDDPSSRTFELQLNGLWPMKNYTVQVDRQPNPIHSSSRFVILEGHPGRVTSDEPASKYVSDIYTGGIVEDPTAGVVGTFRDGVFEGVVHFESGGERSLYVQPHSNETVGFNAVAYWSHDILARPELDSKSFPESRWLPLPAFDSGIVRRSKRESARKGSYFHLCNVTVIIDNLYHKHYAGGNSAEAFRSVANLFFYADAFFRNADLNGDGHRDSYGFQLTKVILRLGIPPPENYNTFNPSIIVRDVYNSVLVFRHQCAGLLFTYRMMSRDDSEGITQMKVNFAEHIRRRGVCSKAFEDKVPKADSDIKDFTEYMTNALPVNFFYKGSKASKGLSVASITHQLGHLMHARDDASTGNETCRSSDDRGIFFMDTPIQEMNPTRSRFSPCSLHDMGKAIRRKKNTDSYCIFGCLRKPGDPAGVCSATLEEDKSFSLVPLTTYGPEPGEDGEDVGNDARRLFQVQSVLLFVVVIVNALLFDLFVSDV